MQQGDLVYYKRYHGYILFIRNGVCHVMLEKYMGFAKIVKAILIEQLQEDKQMRI